VRLSRLDLHENLKDASRGSSGVSAVWGRGQNLRRLLVVAELALSVVLLIGAGLLIRSFARLQDVPPGFNPQNVLTLELTMSGRKYNDAEVALETYRLLWERLAGLPGVVGAGGVSSLPLSQMMAWGPIIIDGRVPAAGEKFINVDMRMVGGEYFRAMEIPLVEGRLFTQQDTRAGQRVALIDAHMAAQYWPNASPLGKRLRIGLADSTGPWITIVGVVGRIKQDALDSESRIAMYLPQTQYPVRGMNVVLRSAADPAGLAAAVRKEIRELDSDLPVYGVRTMSHRVEESLARRRFSMLLLTLFACLALGLAAIGVYGVMAYLVSQGSRELGIRMALGATPRSILVMVVRQGLTVAAVGVGIGLTGAFGLTRLMRRLLFGTEATDPFTFTAIALLLAAIALVASFVPALRAARIDPMISLRSE
jgi:predicted permease